MAENLWPANDNGEAIPVTLVDGTVIGRINRIIIENGLGTCEIWIDSPEAMAAISEGAITQMSSEYSYSNKPYFIVHLADDVTGNTLCTGDPFKSTAPEYLKDTVVYRFCEDCHLKALKKETT